MDIALRRVKSLLAMPLLPGCLVIATSAQGQSHPTLVATDTMAGQPLPAPETGAHRLTPFDLFDLAAQAAEKGDYGFAERALRALAANPDIEIRSEARFRLAVLLAQHEHRPRDAATLLRLILDEKPKAARVRIELARLQALMGNTAAAETQLRAAQAAGLPAAVERDVRFFMQALDAHRHVGANFEATLMPDTNANRATSAASVGTLGGDLPLSADARQHSGLGANVRGQAYAKLTLTPRLRLFGQLSEAITAYRDSAFDDYTLAPRIGLEFDLRNGRVTVLAGPVWRWYATRPYTATILATAIWQHRLNPSAQLRVEGSFGEVTNRLNVGESGQAYTLAVGVDRAMSARMGVGVQANAFRQAADVAAYALIGGGVSAYAYRELGHITLSANAGYSHLEADERLGIFLRRRVDNSANVTLAVTLRNVRVANVSPLIRVRYEKNLSTVDLYSYDRLSGEVGLSASF